MTNNLALDESVKASLPSGTVFSPSEIVLPTIYKKTSKGDFQQSSMRVEWAEGAEVPVITTTHGKVEGKLRDSTKEIFESKSQSSVWNQAVFTVRSMWQKKIDGAYSTEMTDKKEFRPTLAKKYLENKHRIEKEQKSGGLIFVQAKLNGIRGGLLRDDDGNAILQSRTGKDLSKGNQHIVNCFADHFADSDLVLDGELYAHGMSLQEISGAARRSVESEDIKFYVYDIYWKNSPELSYSARFFDNPIHELIKELGESGLPIDSVERLTPTKTIEPSRSDFEASIDERHFELSGPEKDKANNGLGFEGAIVRLDSYPYKLNGRSTGLLKKKWFLDDEYEIIDVWTPKTGLMKGQAMFKVRGPAFGDRTNSVEFDQTPMGTFEKRQSYLEDRENLIGKMVTVKFTEYTNIGIPLHGNAVAIRDYE